MVENGKLTGQIHVQENHLGNTRMDGVKGRRQEVSTSKPLKSLVFQATEEKQCREKKVNGRERLKSSLFC